MIGVPVLVRNGQALTTPEANRNLYVSPAYGPPGPPGADGGPADVGPGLQIVGAEIRYDIQSLTRA